MSTLPFQDVVVMGGGPAGVSAAAAVAPYAEQVHILERDPPHAAGARARRGAPQSAQLHNLLARGQRELGLLFPGINEALIAAGGVESRVGGDVTIFDFGRRMPNRDVGLSILSIDRPALELALRSRLRTDHPNVSLREGCTAFGVSGPPWRVQAATGEQDSLHLSADLIIDARGAATWDRPMETIAPAEIALPLDRWYSSALVERQRGRGFAMCFPTASNSKGALLSPAGSGRWHLSVSGTNNDPPVRTSEQLTRHLASLEDDHIARIVMDCPILEPFSVFRRRQARLVVADIPHGEMPLRVGDSQALLNPLAGLGLSQAFAHASAIRSACAEREVGRPGAEAIEDAAARIALISRQAWDLSLLRARPFTTALMHATGADQEVAEEVVAAVIERFPDVHRLDSQLWHLITPIDESVTRDLVALGSTLVAEVLNAGRNPDGTR